MVCQVLLKMGSMNLRNADEQRRVVLDWLPGRYVDPNTEHVAARKLHHPHSGQWFLNSNEYLEWQNTPDSALWLHAIRKYLMM